MKKKVIIVLAHMMLLQFVNAQDAKATKFQYFGIGINTGFTIGNYKDTYSNNFGVDVVYLSQIKGGFYLGAAAGFTNYFGDTIKQSGIEFDDDNLQFIPLSASIRFSPFEHFLAGPDIGYAIGVNDANEGGFYVSPRVSYLLSKKILFYAGYRLITLTEGLEAIQLGIGFNF